MAGKSITNKVMFKVVVDAGNYQKQLDKLANASSSTDKKTKATLANMGNAARNAGMAMTLGITVPLVAIGKQALNTGLKFEQGLANIQAVTEATSIEMSKFEKVIRDIAKATPYSTAEISLAVEELSKAGLTTSQILNGALYDSLTLAAAGGIDLAESANLAARALITFSKDGLTVKQAADIIVGAANKSTTSVGELGSSFEMVSVVAATAGMSLRDVATGLAVFAQNGMAGSDAGTSLKTMLMNLQPQSTKAEKAMKQLGIITANGKNQFYDLNGNLKDLVGIADVVQKAFQGMGTEQRMMAMRTIFGMDAIRGANVLYKEGAVGIQAMADSIKSVNAQKVAEKKWDTLANKWKKFTNVLADFSLLIFEDILPALTGLVEKATDMAKAMDKMPKPLRDTILVLGLLAAAAGPVLLVLGSIAGAISNLSVLFGGIGATAAGGGIAAAVAGIAPFLPVILAVGAGLVGVAVATNYVIKKNKQWNQLLERNTKPLLKTSTELLNDYKKASKDMAKKSSDEYNKLSANVEKSLQTMKLSLGDKAVQGGFLTNVKEMVTKSKDIIKKSFESDQELVIKYLAKYGSVAGKSEAEILQALTNSNNAKIASVDGAYNSINNLIAKYSGKKKKMTEEDTKVLRKSLDTINQVTTKTLKKTSLAEAEMLADRESADNKARLRSFKEVKKISAEKADVAIAEAKRSVGEELALYDLLYNEGIIGINEYNSQKIAAVERYRTAVKEAKVEELNSLVEATNQLKAWKKEMQTRLSLVKEEINTLKNKPNKTEEEVTQLKLLQEEYELLTSLISKTGDQIENNTVEMQSYNREIKNGSTAFKEFSNGAKSALGGVKTAAQTSAAGVLAAYATKLSKTNGHTIGYNLLQGIIGGMQSKTIGGPRVQGSTGKGIYLDFKADGGVTRKGTSIVGEAGPELMTVGPSGTQITPLTGAQRARNVQSAGLGGGNTINVKVDGGWDNADRIANRVADTMNRILGNKGVNYAR